MVPALRSGNVEMARVLRMYEEVFDDKRQTKMREYFRNELAKLGVLKAYDKNQIIDPACCEQAFAIVTRGIVAKSVVSTQGREKLLYLLRPGEIFGEMNLLDGGVLNYAVKAKTAAQVAFIGKKTLDEILASHPAVYDYLLHSITRKFRIVLLQSTNHLFNDSRGRVAEALLRLSACSNEPGCTEESPMISSPLTQSELAHNVGCSRVTVTRILKQFVQENLISIRDKRIVILDEPTLISFTDRIQ